MSYMDKFEVEFYEDKNGNQPAREFLLSLDKKMRAKMADTNHSYKWIYKENTEDTFKGNITGKKVPCRLSEKKG